MQVVLGGGVVHVVLGGGVVGVVPDVQLVVVVVWRIRAALHDPSKNAPKKIA